MTATGGGALPSGASAAVKNLPKSGGASSTCNPPLDTSSTFTDWGISPSVATMLSSL